MQTLKMRRPMAFQSRASDEPSTWHQTLHMISFLGAICLVGLLFGGIVAGQLSTADVRVLTSTVSQFIEAVMHHQLASVSELWWQRMIRDAQLLALMWLFGMSVIGLPLIIVTLFLRAFSVGFAVGFTVLQFGWKGVLIATFGIFLHQLISLAVLLGVGVLAIRFSSRILRQSFALPELTIRFLQYTFIFIAAFCCLSLAALLHAYLSVHLLYHIFSPA